MSRLRRNTAFLLVGLGEVLRNAGISLLRESHPAFASNDDLDSQVSYCNGAQATVRTRSDCK
jgi:hypothetical protein